MAGGENRFLIMVRIMVAVFYLSVHEIHGSIDKTITGTSANSHPGSMASKDGILANVGVLIFNLSKFLVPLPLI